MTTEYGNCGAGHGRTIDAHLQDLPPKPVVLHLGCGANLRGELDNLADCLASFTAGQAKLIAADRDSLVLKGLRASLRQGFGLGRKIIKVKQIDATAMVDQVGDESVDLILALGLFGDLRYGPNQKTLSVTDPRTKAAFAKVLKESFRVLKPGRHMIISNSVVRQPAEEFVPLARRVGFIDVACHIADVAEARAKVEYRRYLLVLRRPE